MAQWQEVQSLANTYLEQVHQLYAGSALPMAVRQSLAAWIESQNWRQAAEPLCSHARMLFHSLLVLLGERLGSLGSDREDFMLKHNLRKAHRDLQAEFEEKPETFANLVANLLQEERRILRLGQAGGQGGSAPAPTPAPENGREQQIQQRLGDFHRALQEAERAFRHLEDLQDAFDFCFKVHYQPDGERNGDPEYMQELKSLEDKLKNLDQQRKVRGARGGQAGFWGGTVHPAESHVSPQEVLAQMQQLLRRSETLQELLQQELGDWRARQQRQCMGGPGDTNLRPLETWFTELGQGLFQLRQLLRALGDLRQKVTYARDPLLWMIREVRERLDNALSAFVVEQQPCTPNAARRPLVLRTTGKFCARARLLLRLHDRNHRMEARIHIDRDPPNIRGFRRFNILTSSSKTLLAGDSPQEGLLCDFQYLTTTRGGVIISNNNQFSSAWASILWFNMLSSDPKASPVPPSAATLVSPVPSLALPSSWSLLTPCPPVSPCPLRVPQAQQFFSSPPPAPWPRLAEVLSWQFQSVAERGLSRDNLLMLAKKLLGEGGDTGGHGGTRGDTEHLKELWKKGLILGFVSHKQKEKLLKCKRTGTFLLRFSETVLGGVTFTWVEHPETGPPIFHAVEPYTASELVSLALPDIIRDYHMSLEEKNPENPLKFLYPNIARDEAFGPFYSQRLEGTAWHGLARPGNLSESQKYLNRRLIRVSSRPPNRRQTEEELVVATQDLQMLQLQPRGQGTQQPGAAGTVQVLPGGLRVLRVGSGDSATLLGTVAVGSGPPQPAEPPRVPEEQGTLPPELRDLELLPGARDMQELLQGGREMQELLQGGRDMQELLQGAQDMQELLQSLEELEPGLEAAGLMPDVVPALEESFQLSPGSAALLDQQDPFLPQPEDSVLPVVPSLFTDFPPLHIDASDFQ
ncbi:Signal transducer and activator of transcription 2 [Lonchura striata]|uniref:Signal transducer and activator of transcription n=1 Tax=Lonchura striata TaxID=40157 RepID=A0A218UDN2_9PASE|nr:Signal transducer and activator of transcription 2 [Lonchura striata domestica]